MGSARKRPLERAPEQSKDGEVRKKKKGKKSKDRKESNASNETAHHKSSLESTATAEGRIMAQVCSTFSRIEQSRFEAFRRAAFPSDAISSYVAQCLIDEHGETNRAPVLSELVAPGQSEEICIVVSTLAKAYAQRLVTTARLLAGSPSERIQPEDVMKAFQQRKAEGKDPGFFMQAAAGTSILKQDVYQRKRLAAMQAQEEHDKLYPATASSKSEAANDKDDPMDV